MHLPRRCVLTTAIGLCLVGMLGPIALAQSPAPVTNPVADGFQPRAVAFFDAGHGIIAGSIVCPTCAKHRTAAVSTTADGGHTWGTPVTFHAGVASGVTVVPGGTDAWAQVGTRIQHSGDGGTTWSLLPGTDVTGVSFATATHGWAIRRTNAVTEIVASADGGNAWSAGPTPCRPGAATPIFVTRTTTEHGWAVCGGDAAAGSLRQVVWKTVDGGATWTRGFHGVAPGPAGYRFLDDGHGWRWHYVFADIFRSTDGGTTWNDLGSAGNVVVVDLWFVSDTHGFAVMQLPNGASRLRSSADGGTTWSGVATFPVN